MKKKPNKYVQIAIAVYFGLVCGMGLTSVILFHPSLFALTFFVMFIVPLFIISWMESRDL